MLSESQVLTMIPVQDLARASSFYRNILGLQMIPVESEGAMIFQVSGSYLLLFEREPSKADHTLITFQVEDVDKEVDQLSQKGVSFQQYDLGSGITTDEKGVARIGQMKSAWFSDTEGNILAISSS